MKPAWAKNFRWVAIGVLGIFPFAPKAQMAWEDICEDRPYQSGQIIQPKQLKAFERLHRLGVPGFWVGDVLPSPQMIEMSCENYEKFLWE